MKNKSLKARAVFGLFPANAVGDDIVVYGVDDKVHEWTCEKHGKHQKVLQVGNESRVEATLQTVASRHQSPPETRCCASRYRRSRRGTRGHRPAEFPGLLLGSLGCRCLAAQEGAEVSGARGIYRRLRVVEHGCCGRGENLVSVQFVKRSAGDNERSEDSRHKPRSEADSRFFVSSIFLWGRRENQETEDWKRRLSPISRTYMYYTSTAQRTSAKHASKAIRLYTDTLHMSLNDS